MDPLTVQTNSTRCPESAVPLLHGFLGNENPHESHLLEIYTPHLLQPRFLPIPTGCGLPVKRDEHRETSNGIAALSADRIVHYFLLVIVLFDFVIHNIRSICLQRLKS